MKRGLRVFILAGLIAPALFCSCVQQSFDDQCAEQAKDFTERQCPQKVSDGVILDSMTYVRSLRCISYYFTLDGKIDDAAFLRANQKTLHDKLLLQIVNSVELRKVKEHDVMFRYVYLSKKSGKELTSITLTSKEYAKD